MPSNWTKGPIFTNPNGASKLNDVNLSAAQGTINTIPGTPTTTGINQGAQDIPGDRLVLSTADALALSDTTVGTLFSGMYQFIQTTSTATAAFARGRIFFWNTALESTGSPYIVTADETQAQGVGLWSGIGLNTVTAGNFGWMQILGKASIRSRTAFTGPTPAQGIGAYCAGAGAGTDVGTFDIFNGDASNPTFQQVDQMIVRYLGVTEALPVGATITTVDLIGSWKRL